MYHVCMIAYLIEFNEHLVYVCMLELSKFSRALARSLSLSFYFPAVSLPLFRCIVSVISAFFMNVDFECGAAIDLIVRNEN